MAILCILNIVFVMVSVLGIIGFIGWKFGLVECCAILLVLGFSSDYCGLYFIVSFGILSHLLLVVASCFFDCSVHIAHGYLVAPLQDSRKHRCQFAV